MAQKVERKDLQKLLIEVLQTSATFRLIDGLNPCTIVFGGNEYIIYIKNLSPAQLSNNNPDIWRIQLPIRDTFESIKESELPFIILGYDQLNDVYTTWNPYWVKQRLNAAKSVSLYSRLTLQMKAKEEQRFLTQSLNNDGEVVAFPRDKLSYYLLNIKQFFPEMTDYVAMGSRKRTEANNAYRLFTDTKNISDFAHYLALNELQERTINNYCRAIKKLLSEGYISRNRKVFLACDSLSEYPNVLKEFFAIPEVAEINEIWHNTFSAALKAYTQFMLELYNLNEEENISIQEDSQMSNNELFDIFCNPANIERYEDYLTQLKYNSNTVLHYSRSVRYIMRDGYLEKYKSIFLKYSSFSSYLKAVDEFFNVEELYQQNQIRHCDWSAGMKRYVEFLISEYPCNDDDDDNRQMEFEFTPQTTSEEPEENIDIDWETPFVDDSGRLTRIANPKLIDALRPVLNTEYKKTVVALNIIEKFYGDRFKNELKDWNVVINQINWDSPYYNPEETKVSQESKHKSQILRVKTPDGQVFEEQKVLNTLIKVIQYADVEKVRNLNINVCGDNMIVAEDDINERYRIATKYIGKGLYANTCSDTPTKAAIIKQISEQLNLGLQVDFISLDGTKLEVTQPTSSRQKIKVIFPDGKEIRYNTVADTFIEVIQYAGAERVRDLNFTIAYDNLILTENQINPKYAIATKPLDKGFFVNTNIPTTHKAEILSEISERLGLGLIVTIE